MKKNLIIKICIFAVAMLFINSGNFVYADGNVTFLVSDVSNLIFRGVMPLPDAGNISLADTSGALHPLNARSVLAILHSIDESNNSFSISNLQYYDSFSAFYLKCITPANSSEDCDNWQYTVNNMAPDTGMDGTILSGGEAVEIYFGSSYQPPAGSGAVGMGGLVYDYVPPQLPSEVSVTAPVPEVLPTISEVTSSITPTPAEIPVAKPVIKKVIVQKKVEPVLVQTNEKVATPPVVATPACKKISCIFMQLALYFIHEDQKASAADSL